MSKRAGITLHTHLILSSGTRPKRIHSNTRHSAMAFAARVDVSTRAPILLRNRIDSGRRYCRNIVSKFGSFVPGHWVNLSMRWRRACEAFVRWGRLDVTLSMRLPHHHLHHGIVRNAIRKHLRRITESRARENTCESTSQMLSSPFVAPRPLSQPKGSAYVNVRGDEAMNSRIDVWDLLNEPCCSKLIQNQDFAGIVSGFIFLLQLQYDEASLLGSSRTVHLGVREINTDIGESRGLPHLDVNSTFSEIPTALFDYTVALQNILFRTTVVFRAGMLAESSSQ